MAASVATMLRDGTKRPSALRVIEVETGLAGQVCGRLFAALGDQVQRFARPEAFAPLPGLTLGKRQVAWVDGLDGRLGATLGDADVVIVGSAPAQAGVDVARLRARWPELVIVSITTLGLTEGNDLPEDSLLAEAFGGLATMIGEPDARPLKLGGEQASYAAGFTAFMGAVLALARRDAGHGGDVVDVALADVMAYVDWKSDITAGWSSKPPSRSGMAGGAWRIIDAADGKIGVIFQNNQWDALVRLIDDPRLADPMLATPQHRQTLAEQWWSVIAEWAATRPKRAIYHESQALGLPFGFSASVVDLVGDPQFRARDFIRADMPAAGALFQSDGLPWETELRATPPSGPVGPRRPNGPVGPSAPLAGLRVLDLGTITAGAATGRLLADFGASVLKIESSARPDPFRLWPAGSPEANGESPLFESNNCGKLGIDLDLTDNRDRECFYRLVREADVVIENFRVGVTEKLRIDERTLRRLNPNLIYLSLSSQGQTGPEARYRSYGSTLDLLSGLASVTGYEGGGPVWSTVDVNYPDQLVSLFGAGIAAYCVLRGRRGLALDVAQREVVTWALGDLIDDYLTTGTVAAPRGNARPGWLPHDTYPCRGDDRWVAVCCSQDAERAALARLLGLPNGAQRPEWWNAHSAAAGAALTDWTSARDRLDAARDLLSAGVPAAPVLDAADRAAHRHFMERGVFLPGPPRRKGFPFLMQRYQPADPAPAPVVGQHNALLNEDGGWPSPPMVAETGPGQKMKEGMG